MASFGYYTANFIKNWGMTMKQEFMTAARKIGRYLGVVALSFSLLACGGEVDAASNNSTSTPSTQNAQQESLPFPSFPASFEEATYQGQKGCLPNDSRMIFAISKNEGMVRFGTSPVIQTPEDGVHTMLAVYNAAKDYGYILTSKADGKICVSDKLTDYSFKKSGSFVALAEQVTYEVANCQFTPHYTNTCGTFNRLSGALINKGFEIDYQAMSSDGHIDTFLSGNGKSYRLTTHSETGATVITGNGTEEFVFHEIPEVPPKQLIARVK